MGRKANRKWVKRAEKARRGTVTEQLDAIRRFGHHRRFRRALDRR